MGNQKNICEIRYVCATILSFLVLTSFIRPVTVPASHLFFGGRPALPPASVTSSLVVMDGRLLTPHHTFLCVDGGLSSGSSRLCSIYGLCVSSVRLTLFPTSFCCSLSILLKRLFHLRALLYH
ncbi:unnamed protein product [Brassica oleracea]